MPKGSKKPAGGYRAGKKGSYGCNGYPTVSADGTVHGCHPTKARAAAQARAIWASTASKKFESLVSKAMPTTGDFVMFMEDDEIKVGRIEYIMTNPGTLGLADSEYAIEYDPQDPPAIVRCYEEEDGVWEEEPYVYYYKLSELIKIESLTVSMDIIVETTGGMPMADMPKMINPFDALGNTEKRDYSSSARERMAESGNAMPDGSFPIANATDLRNAIQSVGRAKDYAKAKAHITRRAKELGLTNMLPSEWGAGVQKSILADAFDPTFFLK
jgi:hypothetical protein